MNRYQFACWGALVSASLVIGVVARVIAEIGGIWTALITVPVGGAALVILAIEMAPMRKGRPK